MNHLSTFNFEYLSRFLGSILLVFLLLSVSMNASLYFLHDYVKVTKLSLFQKEPHTFTALALGTSHSIGFNFPSLGVKGVNFHDGGGDIEEVLFKSSIILGHAVNIDVIFLSVSPGTLHMSQLYISRDIKKRKGNVISNLPLSYETFSYDFEASLQTWVLQLFPIFEVRQVFMKLLEPVALERTEEVIVKPCFWLAEGIINKKTLLLGGYRMETMKAECIAEYANTTVAHHSTLIELSLMAEPELPENNVGRLSLLAEILEERKGRLILVVPPLTREYYEDVRIQKWLPDHHKLLAKLAKHNNIEVFDFHDFFYEEMDGGTNDYFYDDDHLALPGAIKFSQALKSAMEETQSL
ncbi:SGNH/GDSL hydrolase family protein [Shewanella sp. YLB-07]|uniref:SGNH/GDSL hydrolase family protein n=1 Tax=Shewanella sp. YLB-07 TaxID=2601268 RepID=UPI00128AEB08|nr:SGNH/GDSL hydrolase family protein [Shewanella sp. YLB-07]MPY24851.1 hypothetical protein [Shewanella sp. YLB-07]